MKILTFGEIIWDIYPENAFIGGASLNFAAHMSKLGADVSMVSCIGRDAYRERTLKALENFNLSDKFVLQSDSFPTGKCIVTLDEEHIPSFALEKNTAYDNIIIDDKTVAQLRGYEYDALYFGTLIQRSEVSRNTLHQLISQVKTKHIFCDVNLRNECWNSESLDFCVSNADILKLSRDEAATVAGDGTQDMLTLSENLCRKHTNIKILLITLDRDGAVLYCPGQNEFFSHPVIPTEVKSTVGAGDSFGAAFMYHYLSGKPLDVCLHNAVTLSSYVVSHYDAVPD